MSFRNEEKELWEDMDDDERWETYLHALSRADRLEANEAQWMKNVLEDFRIPFDDHMAGRRSALVLWMIAHRG